MEDNEDFISKTKIVVPRRRAELLRRTRLLSVLEERLERRLIIISAAAGYGKTSLLIDLAHGSDLPFCWLTLDVLDRDPQRFVAGIIASLAEHFHDFGKRSSSLLKSMTSLQEGMDRLLVTLVNEISDDIPEHFALVLDDFHILDDAKPILQFVNRFVQLVGENCHLVIASRTLPDLRDITLLVARDDVGGLDFSDLAFRPEEFQALLAQSREIHLSDEEAQRLVEGTEGWITGLQFSDLDQLRSGARPARSRKQAGITVFDYLGQQVLEQQSSEMQEFLLRSSLLEEFDASLCQEVLAPLYDESPDWTQVLEALVQRNLFVLPVGSDGQWLRYHHLFRDYLQGRFRAECPEETKVILRSLAQIQQARGQWERAHQTYSQLGDSEALGVLIEQAGIPMYQHAMLTLDGWLKALPPSVLNGHPGLLSLRGNIEATKGNAAEGIRIMTQAVDRFRQRQDSTGLALSLARRGSARRIIGEYEDAIRDANEAVQLTETDDNLQWIYADALRVLGLSLFRQGQTLQAISQLDHALSIYYRLQDQPSIPLLLMETALVHAATGAHREAEASYVKALEIWREAGDLLHQVVLLNNLGFLYQQTGEYERGVERLEEGLLCAQQLGDEHGEALISLSLGDLFSEVEDWELAQLHYRHAGDLIRQIKDSFLSNYLMVAEANLALLEREPGKAHETLSRAGMHIQPGDSNYEYGLFELARGKLALQEGDAARALLDLAEAKNCFSKGGREMESAWSGVWMAAAAELSGDRAAALAEIQQVVSSGDQISQAAALAAWQAHDWLRGLRDGLGPKSAARRLFERADRFGDQLSPVRRQLRRVAHLTGTAAPQLVIRAFGAGQVWVNGELVSMNDWQARSVRELFFYFLAARRPLSREQIGAVLWPQTEDPAKLRMRFKNEIYRLRRAVGQETIQFDGEMYYFNEALDHEYDVEAFEAYRAKAQSAARLADQIEFYKKAIEQVQGKYLEDIGTSWILPEQERLHESYLFGLLSLTGLYEKAGELPKALEICQRALAAERTSEATYRRMMQIYGRMGDRGSVAHTYQKCETALKETWGVAPSDETQALYQKLIS